MRIFFALVFFVFLHVCYAQTEKGWNLYPSKNNDTIKDRNNNYGEVFSEKRIESLFDKSIRIDSLNQTMDGYRVQLFSGVGYEAKEEALKIRSEFIGKYPEIQAHLIYDKPNWKVRVGDFNTRLKALEFQRKIYNDFTQGFVVVDEIPLR